MNEKKPNQAPPKNLNAKNSFMCPFCMHRNKLSAIRCWHCGEAFYGPDGIYGGV